MSYVQSQPRHSRRHTPVETESSMCQDYNEYSEGDSRITHWSEGPCEFPGKTTAFVRACQARDDDSIYTKTMSGPTHTSIPFDLLHVRMLCRRMQYTPPAFGHTLHIVRIAFLTAKPLAHDAAGAARSD